MMSKQDEIQQETADKVIKFFENNKIGHINAAMRFGKIACTCIILKKMYKIQPYILIAYPDNKIKDSWVQDFTKWSYENPRIVYTNFSSLSKYVNEIFDLFIIDEWHDLSENQLNFSKTISKNCF